MSRHPGPCLCGDPHCPSCGPLIGGKGICASCEGTLPDDYEDDYCEECLKDIEMPDEEPDIPDNEADAMTLASAGMGTDEDYGRFDDGDCF